MNFKLRLKNKITLATLATLVITFIYQVLGVFEIVPTISQETIMQLVGLILNVFVALGVVVDPTTAGIKDSAQAMNYTEPRKDGE